MITDVVPDLFERACDGKVRNGIRENNSTARCNSRGHPCHVLLSDSRVDVPFGKTRRKWFEHRIPKIARYQPDSRIGFGQLHQRFDESRSHDVASTSASAAASSCGFAER